MHLRNSAFFLEPMAISHLLSFSYIQISASASSCFHIWGGAPKSSLHLFDKVQSKAIHLTNNPNLTNYLQFLSHHLLVADLAIFYRIFMGIALWRSRMSFLVQWGVFEQTEALPNLALSKLRWVHTTDFVYRFKKSSRKRKSGRYLSTETSAGKLFVRCTWWIQHVKRDAWNIYLCIDIEK